MPWTDDDLSQALSELRDEPLPADALATVRTGVLACIERSRRNWLWLLAPVPVAVALTVILMPRPAEVAPPPLIAKTPPSAPFMHTITEPRPRTEPRPSGSGAPQPRPQPRILPTAQDGLVRLASTRNDIVIYWDLTDNKGEAQ
jgi:hypothetical protein